MCRHKCFSLLRNTIIFILGSSLLTACATNSKPSSKIAKDNSTVPTSACIGNAYLQKYGCSMRRINQAAQSGDPDAQYI